MNTRTQKTSYLALFKQVKDLIRTAQYEALKAVNKERTRLYWNIGQKIVRRQKAERWGKSIVERLATDLQKEFPGIPGFSTQNLWYMRQFYMEYSKKPILQPLVGELAWSHNLIILSRCENDLAREFYLRMARRMGWSKNVLIHQIENKTYEKTLINQTNFKKTLPKKITDQAVLAVKDEYNFGFLELEEEHSEMELERALLAKVMKRFRERLSPLRVLFYTLAAFLVGASPIKLLDILSFSG